MGMSPVGFSPSPTSLMPSVAFAPQASGSPSVLPFVLPTQPSSAMAPATTSVSLPQLQQQLSQISAQLTQVIAQLPAGAGAGLVNAPQAAPFAPMVGSQLPIGLSANSLNPFVPSGPALGALPWAQGGQFNALA
ncbi:MAG: hypothetical protein VKK59_07870 [Vampirovibrionales bacterium]|nr:hypothetical protein [Vampirovibrionales bacterium]